MIYSKYMKTYFNCRPIDSPSSARDSPRGRNCLPPSNKNITNFRHHARKLIEKGISAYPRGTSSPFRPTKEAKRKSPTSGDGTLLIF
jgi:hypothetical protein